MKRTKTGGRKRGTPNKSTQSNEEIRNMIKTFFVEKWQEIDIHWNNLKPEQRANFLEKLADRFLPKPIGSLSELSEEDLQVIINQLTKKANENEKTTH